MDYLICVAMVSLKTDTLNPKAVTFSHNKLSTAVAHFCTFFHHELFRQICSFELYWTQLIAYIPAWSNWEDIYFSFH